LIDRNALLNFRESAKLMNYFERKFCQRLVDEGYLYRKGILHPYTQYVPLYFKTKEYTNDNNKKTGVQTLMTVKGREFFTGKYPDIMK